MVFQLLRETGKREAEREREEYLNEEDKERDKVERRRGRES